MAKTCPASCRRQLNCQNKIAKQLSGARYRFRQAVNNGNSPLCVCLKVLPRPSVTAASMLAMRSLLASFSNSRCVFLACSSAFALASVDFCRLSAWRSKFSAHALARACKNHRPGPSRPLLIIGSYRHQVSHFQRRSFRFFLNMRPDRWAPFPID